MADQGQDPSSVVVLSWPEQAGELPRLSSLGVPRLLLVETSADPPESDDCIQDWARRPVDDRDLRARLRALAKRAARHANEPTVDGYGRLFYRGAWTPLSPTEGKMAEILSEHYGSVVRDAELLDAAWPEAGPPSPNAFRVHLTRLRQRVLPLGLEIHRIRGLGCVMQVADPQHNPVAYRKHARAAGGGGKP